MSDAGDERYTLPFWEALAEDRFLAHRCETCASVFFPPAPVCPACGDGAVEWHEVSPRGTLYSYSRQHATPPGFEAPLVVGLVELEAGPRLLSPVAAAYDSLTIGTAVTLVAVAYQWEYDRGVLADYPYFEARPAARSADDSTAAGTR